jgi:hypothetical protein
MGNGAQKKRDSERKKKKKARATPSPAPSRPASPSDTALYAAAIPAPSRRSACGQKVLTGTTRPFDSDVQLLKEMPFVTAVQEVEDAVEEPTTRPQRESAARFKATLREIVEAETNEELGIEGTTRIGGYKQKHAESEDWPRRWMLKELDIIDDSSDNEFDLDSESTKSQTHPAASAVSEQGKARSKSSQLERLSSTAAKTTLLRTIHCPAKSSTDPASSNSDEDDGLSDDEFDLDSGSTKSWTTPAAGAVSKRGKARTKSLRRPSSTKAKTALPRKRNRTAKTSTNPESSDSDEAEGMWTSVSPWITY